MDRAAELRSRLTSVRDRIGSACAAAGRDPAGVTLVAVTKTFPADDVRRLADLGVTDVGENRHQEAAPKAAECADLGLRWHLVGQLQRNKARAVLGWASVVHSVDRSALVTALATAAGGRDTPVDVLVQVTADSADPPGGLAEGAVGPRGGALPPVVPDLCRLVEGAEGLRLRGLMVVAPGSGSADEAFTEVAALAGRIREEHPDAGWLSAGMSGDFESAIRHGSTHVRIGSALLGSRPAMPG